MFERIEVGSPHRPWATALAFFINTTAITLAILLPLLKPELLPSMVRVVTPPITLPHFVPEQPAQPPNTPHQASSARLDDGVIRVPPTIPPQIDMNPDRRVVTGPASDSYDPNLQIIASALATTSTNPPPITVAPPKPAAPKMLIISHLDPGMLIRRVQPVYPQSAKLTHTQGTVELTALINTRGEIEGLQVVSGHPLLVQAAVDAVKQWRYRPYILNGVPIEVQTQVTVNFNLQ